MDEEDFDALQPFGARDAARWDAQMRESARIVATLGRALWGSTPAHLQRQLLAPHPEIPPGFNLTDYHELLEFTARICARVSGLLGAQHLTLWETRAEVVRRAIDYLENR